MARSYAAQRIPARVAPKSASSPAKSPPLVQAPDPATTRSLPVDPLDPGRDPLPDPDAHRGQAPPPPRPAQLVAQHRDRAGTTHPEGMAERDRPAVDVDLCRI